MSNTECATLYERIINEVIEESRQDFEDSGIEEQTLNDLRKIWQRNLANTKVAKFPWGEEVKEDAPEAYRDGTTLGSIPATASGVTTDATSSLVLPVKPEQADGTIEFELEVPEKEKNKLIRKHNKKKVARAVQHHQADGADGADSDSSDLGSDLGIDSDEINSELDDSDESDDMNSENNDPDASTMLCLYDRVQRVRNRWKCSLKEGLANIEGKDYAFQKATGDSTWM